MYFSERQEVIKTWNLWRGAFRRSQSNPDSLHDFQGSMDIKVAATTPRTSHKHPLFCTIPRCSKKNANQTSSINLCKSSNITTIKTFLSWRNWDTWPSKFHSSNENFSRRHWVCFSLPELLMKRTFRTFPSPRRHKTPSCQQVRQLLTWYCLRHYRQADSSRTRRWESSRATGQ